MVIIKYILPSNLAKEKSLHLLVDAFESEDLFLATKFRREKNHFRSLCFNGNTIYMLIIIKQ